jgi:hypothetical protein
VCVCFRLQCVLGLICLCFLRALKSTHRQTQVHST